MCTAMNRSFVGVIMGGFGATTGAPEAKVTKFQKGSADDVHTLLLLCVCIDVALMHGLLVLSDLVLSGGEGMLCSTKYCCCTRIWDGSSEVSKRCLGYCSTPQTAWSLCSAFCLPEPSFDRTYFHLSGKKVCFCVHPVAGRLPGHMNVLLAEVDVPFNLMKELSEMANDFSSTDVAIVVGANDVVNPAAVEVCGPSLSPQFSSFELEFPLDLCCSQDPTGPLGGMPVCEVWKAKRVFVFKRRPEGGGWLLRIPDPCFLSHVSFVLSRLRLRQYSQYTIPERQLSVDSRQCQGNLPQRSNHCGARYFELPLCYFLAVIFLGLLLARIRSWTEASSQTC